MNETGREGRTGIQLITVVGVEGESDAGDADGHQQEQDGSHDGIRAHLVHAGAVTCCALLCFGLLCLARGGGVFKGVGGIDGIILLRVLTRYFGLNNAIFTYFH
jgi:hypothetical protein